MSLRITEGNKHRVTTSISVNYGCCLNNGSFVQIRFSHLKKKNITTVNLLPCEYCVSLDSYQVLQISLTLGQEVLQTGKTDRVKEWRFAQSIQFNLPSYHFNGNNFSKCFLWAPSQMDMWNKSDGFRKGSILYQVSSSQVRVSACPTYLWCCIAKPFSPTAKVHAPLSVLWPAP